MQIHVSLFEEKPLVYVYILEAGSWYHQRSNKVVPAGMNTSLSSLSLRRSRSESLDLFSKYRSFENSEDDLFLLFENNEFEISRPQCACRNGHTFVRRGSLKLPTTRCHLVSFVISYHSLSKYGIMLRMKISRNYFTQP